MTVTHSLVLIYKPCTYLLTYNIYKHTTLHENISFLSPLKLSVNSLW